MTSDVVFDGQRLSGDAFDQLVQRCATSLRRSGVCEGDAVALMLRNDPRFLVALLGIRAAGGYAVPVNWHLAPGEVAYILGDSQARLLFVQGDLLSAVQPVAPAAMQVVVVDAPQAVPQRPASPSWADWLSPTADAVAPAPPRTTLSYTSGTTGRPKGVRRPPLGAEHVARVAAVNRLAFGIESSSHVLVTTPLYHSAPNVYASLALAQAELVVIEPRFDAERTLRLIEQHRITHMYLVPTLMRRLLQLPTALRRQHDLSSLQYVLHGAAPCPPSVKAAFIDWLGPIVHEFYGGSEAGPITAIDSAQWLRRPGSVGRALPFAHVVVTDEEGTPVPPGRNGTVYVFQEAYPRFTYHGRDDLRAACSHPRDPDLFTLGDVGRLDEEGYLYLTDRSKDIVISGGVNIYPAEVEAELLALPGVRDCAVFGVPDDEYGEALLAVVQPEPGVVLDAAVIQSRLRQRLAGFKVPRRIEFRDELPREDTGKIFKRRLREAHWRDAGRSI